MSESSRFGILPLAISSSKQSNSLSTAAYTAAHSLLVNSIVTLADIIITPFKGDYNTKSARKEREMYKIYKAKRINSAEYVIGELSTAKITGTTRQKYLLTPIGENNVYYEIKRDTLRISTNTTDRKGNLIFNRDKALYIDNGGKEHLCTIIGIATDDRVQYGAANEEEQELYMCLPSFGKCEQIELIEEDNCNYCTHTNKKADSEPCCRCDNPCGKNDGTTKIYGNTIGIHTEMSTQDFAKLWVNKVIRS